MKSSDLDGLPRASRCQLAFCDDGKCVIALYHDDVPYTYVILEAAGCHDIHDAMQEHLRLFGRAVGTKN
jgi:hypothetical protein